MSDTEAIATPADSHAGLGSELRKEGSTMSWYTAISLLAALLAVSDSAGRGDVEVAGAPRPVLSPTQALCSLATEDVREAPTLVPLHQTIALHHHVVRPRLNKQSGNVAQI